MMRHTKSSDSPGRVAAKNSSFGTAGIQTKLMEMLGIGRAFTIAVLLFVCLAVIVAVYYFVRSAPPNSITITSGPEASILQSNAVRYAQILARHGVKLKVLTSNGSLENLQRLSDPKFPVDIGFVMGGVTNGASRKLVSLGSVSHQPLLVFYRGAPMELLSGLSGKRLAIGPVGSGTRSLTLTLLEANGIKAEGATALLDLESGEAAKALVDGTVDAVFLMGEDASLSVIRRLLRATDIHLLNFPQAAAYTRRIGYLGVIELPQGSFDLGKNNPEHDVHLIGPTVELIARENLHPALSDLLLEAVREVHGNATLLQRKGEFPAPMEHDFRISTDAARFYKSGRSFFYRYLPFWLASLTSRIVVVFVPMIVVLIPVVRSIPQFYRWRIRSRINRWYRALLALESALLAESDPVKREELLRRLDDIDQAVNMKKVPASFGDLFYGLRGHIAFVRQLVQTSQPK